MSEKFANADPALEEQLVAYLDGELDVEANRRIEELVATDAEVRRKLQRWDRTWQLLDELNTSSVAEEFTQTTLEMVTVAAEEDAQQGRAEAARRRRRRWAITGVSLLAAGLAGFLAVAAYTPDPNRQLLEDLPVLENLDHYRQLDDVEFLRVLRMEAPFSEEDAAGFVLGDVVGAEEPLDARRRRVKNMSPAEKDQLRQLQERFAKLKLEERERLRQLHRQIEDDPNAADLRQVVYRYHGWLKTLAPYQRAELLELEPNERIERIKRVRDEQERREIRAKDLEGLLRWMNQYADKHEDRILETIPEPRRPQIAKLSPATRRRVAVWIMWQRWQMPHSGRFLWLTDGDLAELRKSVSDDTRKQMESKSAAEQWGMISGWVRYAAGRRFSSRRFRGGPPPPDLQEQLDHFFEHELTREQRDDLLSLPGDEMLRALRRMYLMRFRPPGPPIRRPHRPPRGKEPGGPGPPRGRPRRPPEGPRPEFRPAVPRRETRPHDR